MLIVLFIIFLLMIIGGALICKWADNGYDHEGIYIFSLFVTVTTCIAEIIVVLGIISCAIGISQLKIADTKISMYEEENTRIEQDIATIVKDYMNYEKDTYKVASEQIENSSLLVLTELYPNLKSNELVKKQIDVYIDNRNKIKQLKEEKINNQICKWWLYFGEIEQTKEE